VRCRATGTASCAFARPSRASAVSRYDRKDHFHQRAKREGFRSRAVYKLAELAQQHKLLKPGQRVVDLGCWPGGWLQEAAQAVGPKGLVVGVDLAEIDPPLENENVIALVGDLEDPTVCERIRENLGGPCDVLLSDAAPKLTGIRERDRAHEERLLEAIEALIPKLLRVDGDLLVKILEGPEAQLVDKRIRKLFAKAKTVKSSASRKGSTERYLLARGFKGPDAG
jgi:23S rRNA (uridine2552-2'-O)-methyltransferase